MFNGYREPCLLFSSEEKSSFRQEKKNTVKAARDLFYPKEVILKLEAAQTSAELGNIMKTARTRDDT